MSDLSFDAIGIEATLILCRMNIEVGQLAAFALGDKFEVDLAAGPRIAAEVIAGNQILLTGVIEANDGLPFFEVIGAASNQSLPPAQWRSSNGDDD